MVADFLGQNAAVVDVNGVLQQLSGASDLREAADLIEAIMVRLGQLAKLTRRALVDFECQGDPVTVHTLSEAAAVVEKQLWAIESQARPN